MGKTKFTGLVVLSAVLVLLGWGLESKAFAAGVITAYTVDAIPDADFSGFDQCPTSEEVTITDDDESLPTVVPNNKYMVDCNNGGKAINAGIVNVAIIFTSDHSPADGGTAVGVGDVIETAFEILPATIAGKSDFEKFFAYTEPQNMYYTGADQIGEVKASVVEKFAGSTGGANLAVGVRVSGVASVAKDAGDYDVVASLTGAGNFNAFADVIIGEVTIKTVDVSELDITGINPSYGYTGSPIVNIVPTVKFGGGAVVPSADYAVSYGANVGPGAGAGTVTVAASATGNLTGSEVFTFDIVNYDTGVLLDTCKIDMTGVPFYTYDGTAKKPFTVDNIVLKGLLGGAVNVNPAQIEVSYEKNVDATQGAAASDSATITVKPKSGVAGGITGSVSGKFFIARANVSAGKLDLAQWELWRDAVLDGLPAGYTGTAQGWRRATGSAQTPSAAASAIALSPSAGMSGLGTTVTFWYAGVEGNNAYAKSKTAPSDTGDYKVWAVFSGSAHKNFTVDQEVDLGTLRIQYTVIPNNYLVAKDTTITYRPGQNPAPYVVLGPVMLNSTFGVIDSIFYTAVGRAGGGLASASVRIGVNHGAGSNQKSTVCSLYVSGVSDTGKIDLTAWIKGKSAQSNGYIIVSDKGIPKTFTLTVGRRDIDSVKVFSTETYSGKVIEPTTFIAYSGGQPLKYDPANPADPTNEFAVLKGSDVQKEFNMVNAGAAALVLGGVGKYTGRAVGSYTIQKKRVYVSANVTSERQYDGTAKVDTAASAASRLKLWFDTTSAADDQVSGREMILIDAGVPGKEDTLKQWRDYTAAASYSDANAGVRSISATITLIPNGTVAKNYKFVGGNGRDTNVVSVAKGGITINKRTPLDYPTAPDGDTATFVFAIPDTTDAVPPTAHYYNGSVRGIETAPAPKVAYKGGMVGGPLTVLYGYPAKPYYDTTIAVAKDTTIAPRDAGVYAVKVRVPESDNFEAGEYVLGEYRIKAPAKARFGAAGDLQDATFREGNSITLSVAAVSPNGPASALSYKWYKYTDGRFTDSVVISGATGPAYTVSTGAEGDELYYAVKVTNNPGAAVQLAADTMSRRATIKVDKAAVSMSKAVIVVNPDKEWVYKGDSIKPAGADVTVWLPKRLEDGSYDTTEIPRQEYALSYQKNVNVGTATIRASGVDAYSGTVSAVFEILPKTLERSDLTYTAARAYSGDSTLGADVKAVQPKTGMGAITVFYDGSTSVPVNVGEYDVTATVAVGTNFTAGEVPIGTYRITMRKPDSSCVVFGGIPTGHKEGDPATVYGVGEVKLKGTGYESVTVYYGADTTVPNTTGSYPVKVVVAGGENYTDGEVTLGMYNIGAVSVVEAAREVPKAVVVEEASVAPVTRVAASFTAGPSPVSKSVGKISFFSSAAVKGGTLYVFDANGNAMAKIPAKGGSNGKEIAAWNLRGKNGAAAAEGTYVVKGALVGKDGKKEKVSFVFSVK